MGKDWPSRNILMVVSIIKIFLIFINLIITCPFSIASRQESTGKLLKELLVMLLLDVLVDEQEEEESLPWSNVIVCGWRCPKLNMCQVNAQNAMDKCVFSHSPCLVSNLLFNPSDPLVLMLINDSTTLPDLVLLGKPSSKK